MQLTRRLLIGAGATLPLVARAAIDWPRAAPAEVNMDGDVLAGLDRQFAAWPEVNLHAALILRHGRLVHESYFTGEDWAFATPLGRVTHHADLRHDLRSISKSVTSLIVGAARVRGWFADLDAPLFDEFPEHADLRTPEKARITLRHALTMTAGFAWNETLPYSDPANSERRMMAAPDHLRFVLEQPVTREPGAAYLYNGGLTALLAAIVARRAGRGFDAVARELLFDPLGLNDVEWVGGPPGVVNVVSGLRLTARETARIGQLMLDGGVWAGRQVVPRDWIEESTTPWIHGEGLHYYGYQWWLGRSLARRRDIAWVAAYGNGGQRLYVVPTLGLVVVAFAGLYNAPIQSLPGEIVLRRYALAACRDV